MSETDETITRCTKSDDTGTTFGCISPAGHLARCKVRENAVALFAAEHGQALTPPTPAPTPTPTPMAADIQRDARQNAVAADSGDRDDRMASMCELATAMGMARFHDDDGRLGWINPKNGKVGVLNAETMDLYAAEIVAATRLLRASPASLMSILDVEHVDLPGGEKLFVACGKMVVQTASGALRPARLDVAPATGPAGDGGLDRFE